MKKITLFLMLFLFSSSSIWAKIENLLPKPQNIETLDCSFSLNQNIQLILPTIPTDAPAIQTELEALIVSNGGQVVETSSNKIILNLDETIDNALSQEEAYLLTVCANNITINAKTAIGAYRAIQTLWQLSEESNGTLEGVKITDWASFKVRGYMHDIGRSYISVNELKNQILRLSRYKINVFHWHLTDNQGWRLESKIYPALNANTSYSRYPGKFYTIEEAKEILLFARNHGVMVIPEIDMPGHSEAFRKAMGHSMLTSEGLAEMKKIMTEACSTFELAEWIHIGTDEVRSPDLGTMDWTNFVPQMVAHIRSKGKKVISWNPGYAYGASGIDMTQMWSSRGSVITGVPAIDSRYHYINHYDKFADIVSLYNSTIAEQQQGSDQYAGVIIGIWNDRIVETEDDIIKQNTFYPAMLAIAERAWLGGGKGYFTQIGTTLDPTDTDFVNWEERFLFHKAHFLSNEPIAYVQQSNVRWEITDAFPNNGNLNAVFPPETAIKKSYTYNGNIYNTNLAVGAGIYLRHVWGTLIPAFFTNPQANTTAYAYTYVYSPQQQTVGAQVEFQNYGRSEADLAPPQGKWDYYDSKIWINGQAINPPVWGNTHTTKSNETPLKNENFSARAPIPVTLNIGWNKILIKLPNNGFSHAQVRLAKWMFTCVLTTLDGKNAVDGLIYSPDKNLSPSKDLLLAVISKAETTISTANVGEEPGFYSASTVNILQEAINNAKNIAENTTLSDDRYKAEATALSGAIKAFKENLNRPKISKNGKTYWYSLSTPLRKNGGNNTVTYNGDDVALTGNNYTENNDNQLWKITENTDGTYNLIPKASESHLSPNSDYNSALTAKNSIPTQNGWDITPLYTNSYFVVTSGTVQLNQTGAHLGNKIYNWGGGNNTTDVGCIYQFTTRAVEGASALDLLILAINKAKSKILSVDIGEEPGRYSQEKIDAFQALITQAEQTRDNESATEEQLQNAYTLLNQQTTNFLKKINMPMVSDESAVYWYVITATLRENKALYNENSGDMLIGKNYEENNLNFLWKLVRLANGSLAIVNKATESYINTESPKNSTVNSVDVTSSPQEGWGITPTYNQGLFVITSNTNQLNQTNGGLGYKIYNWGGGNNTTDTGCQFSFRLKTKEILTNSTTYIKGVDIDIWIENGYLKTDDPTITLRAFNISGQEIAIERKLPRGVVLIQLPNNKIVKLFVK